MFYLETSFSSLDFCSICLSPCSLSSYLRGCTDYNENERLVNGRYVYHRICSSDSHAAYLHYVFASEDTDDQRLIAIVHVALFISSVPLVGLPNGCYTFLAGTVLEILVQKLTLQAPRLVQPLPCPRGLCEYRLNLSLFLPFKMSNEVCKTQHSRRALVIRLTFLFSDYSSRWRWDRRRRMVFLNVEPTVFGPRTRTKRLTAFVNSYPVNWMARFVLCGKLVLSYREGLVFRPARMMTIWQAFRPS